LDLLTGAWLALPINAFCACALSICPSVCLLACLPVCLSVCLSTSPQNGTTA